MSWSFRAVLQCYSAQLASSPPVLPVTALIASHTFFLPLGRGSLQRTELRKESKASVQAKIFSISGVEKALTHLLDSFLCIQQPLLRY